MGTLPDYTPPVIMEIRAELHHPDAGYLRDEELSICLSKPFSEQTAAKIFRAIWPNETPVNVAVEQIG